MGVWQVPADLLARARFVLSPMADVVTTLGALTGPRDPSERALAATVGPAFRAMLDEHPGRAEVHARLSRPAWIADFLGLPPRGGPMSFAEEVDLVAARGAEQLRADLVASAATGLPALPELPGLVDHVTGLLEWVWTHVVSPDWPRRERVLRADVVSRTSRLAGQGWAGVLADLGRGYEWLGGSRLRINHHDHPPRDLALAEELYFVPHHGPGNWVGWDLPTRYAIHYPVTGTLASPDGGSRSGLADLVGGNRAAVLAALDGPQSTTALVARTGLSLGSVGGHLKVLLRAGLVLRRRSGREVLYWRTALGEALVGTGAPEAGR